MSTRAKVLVAAAAAAAIATLIWWPGEQPAATPSQEDGDTAVLQPSRPSTPPVPGRDVPRRAAMPELPPNAPEIGRKAYAEAIEAGADRPGEEAFRATVDAFLEYNRSFAEAQASQEGITVAEVHELTYFGFLAMRTQQWSEIEDFIGRSLTPEERELGEQLMHESNREFKAAMRELVADGAAEAERWALIQATRERYLREYYAITGMTPALLDDLLAGDLGRTGAPIATPPPEDIPPGPAYTPPEPRPQDTP